MSATDPATLFAALGEPTRLSLLTMLGDGRARSIMALSADSRISRQAVTKHLHVLEKANLVRSVRTGRENRFALRPETMALARDYLDRVSAAWDEALGRLNVHLEEREGNERKV